MNLPVEKDMNNISFTNIVKTVANNFNYEFSTKLYTPEFLKQNKSCQIYQKCSLKNSRIQKWMY